MDAKKFGQFISQLRKEQNMTQAELASKLYVTDKAVSKWERGLGLPDINSIEPLASALGVSIAEIMQSERITSEHVTQGNASELLTNAFELVKQQRKAEASHILRILGIVIAAALVLMLGPGGVIVLAAPLGCLLGSLALLAYGIWRKCNQLPAARTFILALLLIVVPLVIGTLLHHFGILTITRPAP